MKYSITSQEFGCGEKSVERFATLEAAAHYIAARWQGEEYRDGPVSFHTDYCSYVCRGFRLDQVTARPIPPLARMDENLTADADGDGPWAGEFRSPGY